ncbi:MAG: methyltransferase domain-containing protein [Nitrospinota bacterium]|nr:methyltransferase domain-containing protein [Nitrospinota bacterium]
MTPHAQQVQTRFSEEAQNWSGLYQQTHSTSIYTHNLQRRKQYALGLLEGVEGRVLEIGCGSGNVIRSLPAKNGTRAFGADFSIDMLRQASLNVNSRGGALPLLAADAHSLPFADGVFDAILCLGLLEYIPDYNRVLTECRRILQPGGQLVVSVPNIASPFIKIDDLGFGLKNTVTRALPSGVRRWIKARFLGRRDKPYFNHRKLRFNPEAFTERLDRIGLRVQETRYHTFGFGLLNGVGLNIRLSEHLESHIHRSTPMEKFGWTCILKAIKA